MNARNLLREAAAAIIALLLVGVPIGITYLYIIPMFLHP